MFFQEQIVATTLCCIMQWGPAVQYLPAAVNTILLADSMGKSFLQNDSLIKVITMAGSNYYYASGLIASNLLDISHFHQVFTLLGSNLLKSLNTTSLLKAAVQEFVKVVHAANPGKSFYWFYNTPSRGKMKYIRSFKIF